MIDQKPHPISLEKLFFTRSVVESIPGHQKKPSKLEQGPINTVNVELIEGLPGHYSVSMTTILNPNRETWSPYHVDMECIAELVADDTLSPAEAHRGVYITAHSVLYGAIREAVSWCTSRQIYGPLLLGLNVLRPISPAEAKATGIKDGAPVPRAPQVQEQVEKKEAPVAKERRGN